MTTQFPPKTLADWEALATKDAGTRLEDLTRVAVGSLLLNFSSRRGET